MKPPIVPRVGMMTPEEEARAKARLEGRKPTGEREMMLEIEEVESSPSGRVECIRGMVRGPRGGDYPVTIVISGRSRMFTTDLPKWIRATREWLDEQEKIT